MLRSFSSEVREPHLVILFIAFTDGHSSWAVSRAASFVKIPRLCEATPFDSNKNGTIPLIRPQHWGGVLPGQNRSGMPGLVYVRNRTHGQRLT